jgi:hypothetical protein
LGSNNLEATDGWLATTAETKSVTALQRHIYLLLSGAKEFRPNAAEDNKITDSRTLNPKLFTKEPG